MSEEKIAAFGFCTLKLHPHCEFIATGFLRYPLPDIVTSESPAASDELAQNYHWWGAIGCDNCKDLVVSNTSEPDVKEADILMAMERGLFLTLRMRLGDS